VNVPRDIAVTGAACATSLGLDRESTWKSLCQGLFGLGPMTALESVPSPDKGGGQAPDLPDAADAASPREVRYLGRVIRDAWQESVADSLLPYPPDRCGIVLGTTLHGMRAAGAYLRNGDYGQLSAFLAGAVVNRSVGDVPLRGWSVSPCAACASGLAAIAQASLLLESGQLDLVVAGGYDTVSEYAYGGFNSLRLMSGQRPRPFARDRDGMKVAEGYGVVILERRRGASDRGAPVLAWLRGMGASSDAHHLSEPHPDGDGAARAMRQALSDAGIHVRDIHVITAHGTGTADNDRAEVNALRSVFGPDLARIPVTAYKGSLGHTLGGAGSVELVLSILALRDRRVPPVPGLGRDAVEFEGLDVVTDTCRTMDARYALCSSFGFGGSNACIVLESAPAPGSRIPSQPVPSHHSEADAPAVSSCWGHEEVWITGIGVLVPGAVGIEEFSRRIRSGPRHPPAADAGPVPEDQIAPLVQSRRVRRMSRYVKLTLAASTLSCRHAGVGPAHLSSESAGALLGTTHGSAAFCLDYYSQIVRDGLDAANPSLFAEGVPNAASAHLSMMLGLRGPCQTLIGSRTSGLEALALAALRLSRGDGNLMIVGAADEYATLNNAAYGHCGLVAAGAPAAPFTDSTGFVTGEGAVTFVLERAETARRRDAVCLGRVDSASACSFRNPPERDGVRLAGDCLRRIGCPSLLVSSANATWIDRFEMKAVRDSYPASAHPSPRVTAWYGLITECFSAGPLMGIASLLLGTPGFTSPAGVMATGYNGSFVAVRIRPA
jgi:3-oxoacyl-[acyl-carrier-protein] synthase II